MSRYPLLAALLLLGPVACSSGDDASGGAAATSDAELQNTGDVAADVAAYELSMERIDRFYNVQRNLAVAMSKMSPEEREAMDLAMDGDSETMDDLVRTVESNPVMKEALDDAGMSAREYATAALAIMQAGMAAAVIEMRPNDDADSLVREMNASMENVRFMQEHEAELQQKQQQLEAELRSMGIDDDAE